MTDQTQIKTRADGSIDTAHYMARGREMRSHAFWAVLGALRPRWGGLRRVSLKRPALSGGQTAVRTPA